MIAKASFQELLLVLQNLDDKVPVLVYVDLSKRFYEIALLDDDVPDSVRKSALELAEAAQATLNISLAGNPEALMRLHAARQSMLVRGKRFGHKSLFWKMRRDSILPADRFRYGMKPENRPLIEAYFEALGSEFLEYRVRSAFIQELIWQSEYKVSNAVIILHGLAAKRDVALCKLFRIEEYHALLRAAEDYAAARIVLVDLGLLPSDYGAKPMRPLPELTGFVANILLDKFVEVDATLRDQQFSEREKEVLSVAARFLFIDLAVSQVKQISDHPVVSELFSKLNRKEIAPLRELFRSAHEDVYREGLDAIPLDTALLMVVMAFGEESPSSDDEFAQKLGFISTGTEWLNRERVQFLEYLRFLLRELSTPTPRIESDVDRDLIALLAGIYHAKGARSTLAENVMNFEDWIGDR